MCVESEKGDFFDLRLKMEHPGIFHLSGSSSSLIFPSPLIVPELCWFSEQLV